MRSPDADWAAQDVALTETLAFAVPLWMAEVWHLDPEDRQQIATRAAKVTGAQGDTLQYGSGREYGHGTRQLDKHLAKAAEDEKCPDDACWCNRTGQPSYSAGEVFSELAKGLACAAFQSGGITFAGLHWCAAPHPGCPREDTAEGKPR